MDLDTTELNPNYIFSSTATESYITTYDDGDIVTFIATTYYDFKTEPNILKLGFRNNLVMADETLTISAEMLNNRTTSYNTVGSTESFRTRSTYTLMDSSSSGVNITETYIGGNYYEPIIHLDGSFTITSIDSSYITSATMSDSTTTESYSISETDSYVGGLSYNGSKTYTDTYTTISSYTRYLGAPNGYVFSNTSYKTEQDGKYTKLSFRSYFTVYDSGNRNTFLLTNSAELFNTSDNIRSQTSYSLTFGVDGITDAYSHFETDSSEIIYTDSLVNGANVSNYENKATFWYVKPDMDFSYSREINNASYHKTDVSHTIKIAANDNGIIEKNGNLCVLNMSERLSSWTDTIDTRTIITTYVTTSIKPVIGGGDPSKYTTISNTFPFGKYSQDSATIKLDSLTYSGYLASVSKNISGWYSTYTYSTRRTYDLGESTVWHSTLTSAVYNTVTTFTKSAGTITYDYTTKSWWVNRTVSVGLRTISTSVTTKGTTTTTGNQIVNQFSSETYDNSYVTTYTGVSWFDKYYYSQRLEFSEVFFGKGIVKQTVKNNGVYLTADLPLIYQSETASATIASQSADYITDKNGMTNRITRSVSVIITSDEPINYTYLSVANTRNVNTNLATKKRDTSFFLTSHIEVYTVLGSQGWFNRGFDTIGNVRYVPAIKDFSELTNYSGLVKSTGYDYYTWSHERIYSGTSYKMSYRNSSSIDFDYYSFWAGTKITPIANASLFTSYKNIDLNNGTFNSQARLLVGTSWSADTDVWTISHYSSAESQWDNYSDGQSYVRSSSTLANPTLIETFTWSNPRMFDAETYMLINSAQESDYSTENAFGTTILNGTFFTASDSSTTRTFAQGTSLETQLFDKMDSYSVAETDFISEKTSVKTAKGESIFNTTTTDYVSWSGISYTANYLSRYNVRTSILTMAQESRMLYTGYQYTATRDTYYITSIFSEGYTLSKVGSYTTNGYTENGGVLTREYNLSARQGYITSGIPFGTYSSTAKEKIVKIITSSVGYDEVTYYDTYFKQTAKALADIKDLYTTFTTTSVFGVDEVYREPECITGISTYSSITGKKGKTKYRNTYVSNGKTLTKGIGY